MDANEKSDFLSLAFHTFLQNSPDMIFVKDLDLVYLAASDSFAAIVGLRHGGDIVGKTDYDIFEQELARKYTVDDRAVLASGSCVVDYIEPLPDHGGKRSYSSTSKYVIRAQDQRIVGLYGVARDVTAQVELETEREAGSLSRQMFDDILEADLTEDKMLRVAGSEWMRTLGVTEESRFSETVYTLSQQFVHPEYRVDFIRYYERETLRDEYEKGTHEFSHITYLKHKNAEYRWMECRTRVYHSRISNTLRATTFLKDVDDEVRSKHQLQERACTDALTGLKNRASVLDQIETCLADPKPLELRALLFIDLDHFKEVNDNWGHKLGDQVLQKVAERLQSIFNGQDVVGRIGGDEFMVFLSNAESRQAVEQKVCRVVEKLSFYQYEGGDEVWVTCSVGAVLCQGDGKATVEQLYEQADKALYQAKETGRSRVCFCGDKP